jgi:VanZ family protein
MNAFRSSGVKGLRGFIFSLVFCVLYAISDEVHQLFVPGRGAQVTDVMIDSFGAFVGIGVYGVICKIKKVIASC